MPCSRTLIMLALVALAAGCQAPGGGQPNALSGLGNPPRMFNGGGSSLFAQNQNNAGGSWFPWLGGGQGANNPAAAQQAQWLNGLSDQMRTLNSKLGQFDTDNQQMLTEIAGLKQKLQAAGDYNFQLKQQLTDSIAQLQLVQAEKRNIEQQLATAQVRGNSPMNLASGPNSIPGGATLRANNSLMQKLPQLNIPGAEARMDGDVIRIEIPTDQIFQPGTYQLTAQSSSVIQQVATAIQREFPQQIIGVEAHWDNTPLQERNITHHQLTSSQALSIYNYLTRFGLADRQIFTMAMGSNRPRHPPGITNGISPNRRVEIVIYPETVDGN